MQAPGSAGELLESAVQSVLNFVREVTMTLWRATLTPRALARSVQRGTPTSLAPPLAYLVVCVTVLSVVEPLLDSPWEDPTRIVRAGLGAARAQQALDALFRALPILALSLCMVWIFSRIAGSASLFDPRLRLLVFYSVGTHAMLAMIFAVGILLIVNSRHWEIEYLTYIVLAWIGVLVAGCVSIIPTLFAVRWIATSRFRAFALFVTTLFLPLATINSWAHYASLQEHIAPLDSPPMREGPDAAIRFDSETKNSKRLHVLYRNRGFQDEVIVRDAVTAELGYFYVPATRYFGPWNTGAKLRARVVDWSGGRVSS